MAECNSLCSESETSKCEPLTTKGIQGYPPDIQIQPGQINVKLFEKCSTIFRASRNKGLPLPQFYKKQRECFAKEESVEEWSGHYFFASPSSDNNYVPPIDSAKGYGVNYVDETTGHLEYHLELMEVKKEFFAIVINNHKYGSADIPGYEKALALKHFFKTQGLGLINNNDKNLAKISDALKEAFSKNDIKLVSALDDLGLAYMGPHTEDVGDNELILGFHTLEKIKPKIISKVFSYCFDAPHESPKDFLNNTNFESKNKEHHKRQLLLSKTAKLPEQIFLSASDFSDVTQEGESMKQHLDASLKKVDWMITEFKNMYLIQTRISQVQALEAVTEIVKIATTSPSVAAMIVLLKTDSLEHVSSLLAGAVARENMAPLAEIWISSLHLLFEKKHLSGAEVISALLLNTERESGKSLAHAIAGAAWVSDAATKLCTLLSEVASRDNQLEPIITRLSIKQSGYDFHMLKLNMHADFYNIAKHADNICGENAAAKAHLNEGLLIPQKRELYRKAFGKKATAVHWEPSFEALQKKIKDEITPTILDSHDKMKKENADMEQARKSTGEKRDEINYSEKCKKEIASNKFKASLYVYNKSSLGESASFKRQKYLNPSRPNNVSVAPAWPEVSISEDSIAKNVPLTKAQDNIYLIPLSQTNVKVSDTPKTDDKKCYPQHCLCRDCVTTWCGP